MPPAHVASRQGDDVKRSGIRSRRATPRRREAPRWTPQGWEEANSRLAARSGGRCECCGDPLAGQVERHHRVRRRDGGDRLANLLYLSPAHHAWWTRHPEQARVRGLIVSAWQDPGEVPVLLAGAAWRYLDDQGGTRPAPEPPGAGPSDLGPAPE